jgi:glycosyltransferase involved in cell wall biosynthesis
LAHAIVEMASDAERRKVWGAAARERIRTHFNIKDSIAQHKALFEELVKS